MGLNNRKIIYNSDNYKVVGFSDYIRDIYAYQISS